MKIIVTGCKGQLGTELLKQLQEGRSELGPIPEKLLNATVIPVDLPELDISNYRMVDEFVRRNRPDIIINCAAYTNVDGCEVHHDDAFKAKWAQLIAVRDEVKKVLEQARAEKLIGASLEASVTLYCSDAVYDLLNSIPMDELADLMIVSHVELVKGEGGAASAVEGLGVAAAHATGDKCERCWKYSASIGSHPAHPTLCARCASVVEA